MAKPLGEKAKVIRQALSSHPKAGNTDLADMINKAPARSSDGIKVTANDVARQKLAIKKAAGGTPPTEVLQVPVDQAEPVPTPKRRGRKPGSKNRSRPAARAAAPVSAPIAAVSPVDLIDRVFALVEQCGGTGQLKRLVEMLVK